MSTSYEAIKNLHAERRSFAGRVIVAGVFCGLALVMLSLRLTDLQVLQHDYFTTRADGNRMRVLPVPPVRGLLFDRSGAMLAQNNPAFQLEITPDHVDKLDDTLARLSTLVRITPSDIARFKEHLHKQPRYRGVVLRSNLTPEEVANYELNRYDFQGVDVTAGLVRSYPLGNSAAHVLGYVGGISDADYANLAEADYEGLTQIGKSGIERSHEDELRGTPGAKIVEANAGGRPLRDLDSRQGIAGQNLYLTLDSKLQLLAEKALGDFDGAVVALDPRNGEVLALVSKPGFDPGQFTEGIDSASYKALLDDPDRPLYNRALLGTYPPGSTIKPFMAVAGLQYNTINPNQRTFCSGTFTLGNSPRKYRCWQRHGHGALDLEEAITKSCDVYFYEVAQTLGVDRMDEMLGKFGLGTATGVDVPNEKNGLLPSREWKRRVHREVWFPGETISMGIGQGYWQVTMMQMAQATARLAMHGGGFKPHMVHAMENPATHQLTAVEPEALEPIKLVSPTIYDRIIAAMQDVTSTPSGTAYKTYHDAPYTSGGKSGTAQVAGLSQEDTDAPKLETLPTRLRDHALFVAFAPVEDPRIVVAVVAEHAGHGGSAAAPVARQLMDQWLLGKVVYTSPNAPPAAVAAPTAPETPSDTPPDEDVDPSDTSQ